MLKRMPKHSVCAEIGVHEGGFSEQILRLAKPIRLHLIDPWQHEGGEQYMAARYGGGASGGQAAMERRFASVRERFSREINRGQVMVHRAESSAAVASFPEAYFDWIYIDGNHLRDFVKSDLNLYFPKVRPGGFIAGTITASKVGGEMVCKSRLTSSSRIGGCASR
jgi:hypothetical protein